MYVMDSSKLLRHNLNAQECDATKNKQSDEAGLIIIKMRLLNALCGENVFCMFKVKKRQLKEADQTLLIYQ